MIDDVANPEGPQSSAACPAGAAPDRATEIDTRPVWNRERALQASAEALDLILQALTAPGAPFGAEAVVDVLGDYAQLYHDRIGALDIEARMVAVEIEELQAGDDRDDRDERALELAVARSRDLVGRRDAFAELREAAAERYRAVAGKAWRAREGDETVDDAGTDGDGIPF